MQKKVFRIGLQTFGSEGDIIPFLTLAGGLSEAGYECTLNITPLDDFDYSIYEQSLNIKVNRIGTHDQKKFLDLKNRLFSLSPSKQGSLSMEYYLYSQFDEIYTAANSLCESTDLIITHFLLFPLAMACEKKQQKHISFFPTAISVPTPYIPPLGLPDLGYHFNSFVWKIIGLAVNKQFKNDVNRFRKSVGLHPIKDFLREVAVSKLMNFVSVSPSLYNANNGESDTIQAIGYLGNPKEGAPFKMPEDLQHFLDTPRPVVYVTFGSMNSLDPNPNKTIDLLLSALKLANVRGIIQYNWDEYSGDTVDNDTFRLTRVPHQEVFPLCSLIVHHGGAGTTQAAAVSGRPSVVISHGVDQSYNGGLLKKQGLCTAIIPRKRLTPDVLSNAILKTIKNNYLKSRAEEISKKIKKEAPVERALALIRMVSH